MKRFLLTAILTAGFAANVSAADLGNSNEIFPRLESLERRMTELERRFPAPSVAIPTPVVSAVQFTAVAEDAPVCANGRCSTSTSTSTSTRTTSTYQQSTGERSGPLRRLFGR